MTADMNGFNNGKSEHIASGGSMISSSPLTLQSPPAAAAAGTKAPWLPDPDDLALGCECADPFLQIERWPQEALETISIRQ
jgi:hypothetical protein